MLGTNSCSSASALAPSSELTALKPVTLPPGRLRLATSPSCTGSLEVPKTIGMLVVAALAARADNTPGDTITATRSLTRSAASAGSRSTWFPPPAIFDHQVLAFNVAGLVQTLPEASQPEGIGLRRPVV